MEMEGDEKRIREERKKRGRICWERRMKGYGNVKKGNIKKGKKEREQKI